MRMACAIFNAMMPPGVRDIMPAWTSRVTLAPRSKVEAVAELTAAGSGEPKQIPCAA